MDKVQQVGRGVNDKTVVAAIDIGKEHNTGILYSQVYEMKKSFVFRNDRDGFEVLWGRITEVQQRHGLTEVAVVIESTGSYGEPLQNYAQGRGATLWQVNPHHTKRLREVVDNSPEKSDAKDPRVILTTFLLGKGLTVVIPAGLYGELRSLSHARERGVEQRVRWENQLESIMFSLFPEFDRVMHGFRSRSSQRILSCWPTPEEVVKCGVAQLAVELQRVSRGRLGQVRAAELYAAAQRSIGVPQGRESAVMEVRQLLSLLEAERTYLDGLEAQMEKNLDQIPMSKHLLSIRGVGVVTVAGLWGEYGDLRRFETIGTVEKFSGLNLFEVSSGKHHGKRRISKRGRWLIRKLLYLAALNTVRKGGIYHDWYQQYVGRGHAKNQGLVAVSRKLLRLLYALVRDNRAYRADYQTQRAAA